MEGTQRRLFDCPVDLGRQREDYLRLALARGVGPQTLSRLLAAFGHPTEVLACSCDQLRRLPGVGPKLIDSLREAKSSDLAPRVIEHSQQHNVRLLIPGDEEYPRLLAELPDPPPLLLVKGRLQAEDQLAIGVVGTRHASPYGLQQAERFTRALSMAGLTIVSGLARGIDRVAHQTALDHHGRTLAFLGSSVTDIYPAEHVRLAESIVSSGGALISETHPFAQPKSGVFPQRNRLISGMSLGVLVIEAAQRSGALITARHACDQGRDVFALPGPVNSRTSAGCHRLIRDGATLVHEPLEILDQLGPLVDTAHIGDGQAVRHATELTLNDQEKAVLYAIDINATDLDQVIIHSRLPASRVLSTLSVLEMRGLIRRHGGRSVSRK